MSVRSGGVVETLQANVCCVCTLTQTANCRNIAENFLKVNTKYESLKNILIKDLSLISYAVSKISC